MQPVSPKTRVDIPWCYMLTEAWSWRHLESGLRESSEFVKQQLAEENAAWRHIVKFVFGNEENNVKEKYVQNRGAECCTTSRSGRWCRRSQPGHLHLATFQGHHHQQVVKNRNDLNHDATNWVHQFSYLLVYLLRISSNSIIRFNSFVEKSRHLDRHHYGKNMSID